MPADSPLREPRSNADGSGASSLGIFVVATVRARIFACAMSDPNAGPSACPGEPLSAPRIDRQDGFSNEAAAKKRAMSRLPVHPFRPVTTTPRMKARCAEKKITRVGIIINSDAAMR